jgi:chromodomain-helicase-DNA-binding protein 4
MYVGSFQARSTIREYEFYFPKNSKNEFLESIKFDVLLTSYEIINQDTASLKHIKWECMVKFYSPF